MLEWRARIAALAVALTISPSCIPSCASQKLCVRNMPLAASNWSLINSQDASVSRNGDIVRVFNAFGQVLVGGGGSFRSLCARCGVNP